MKQWWQQLQQREQRLVLLMAIFIGIFVFYQGVWKPLNDNIDNADQKLERTHSLLSYVKSTTAKVKSAGSSNRKVTGGSLSTIVNRVAAKHQISIARMQPQGENVQVWIDEVAFNQLLVWLDDLNANQGLTVSNIDISKGETAGAVKIRRLQISRG